MFSFPDLSKIRTAYLFSSPFIIAALLIWNVSIRRSEESLKSTLETREKEVHTLKTEISKMTKEVREITRKPDGTVIEKVTKIDKSTQVSKESSDKTKETSETVEYKKVESDKSRYLVGGGLKRDNVYFGMVGARIGDLPVMGVVMGETNKSFGAGVLLEW